MWVTIALAFIVWVWGIVIALGMFAVKERHRKTTVWDYFLIFTSWGYVGKEIWERLYYIQRTIEKLPEEAEGDED